MSLVTATLLRGALVSALALALSWILRRGSGASRHLIATLGLAILLVLPLGTLLPPRVVIVPAVPVLSPVRPSFGGSPSVDPAASPAASPGSRLRTLGPSLDLLALGAQVLYGIYLLGEVTLLVRLALGWLRTVGYARRAGRLGLARDFEVRVSSETPSPVAVWWGMGLVLLPEAYTDWNDERREAVLRHEGAHLRRGDLLALLVARITLALHWPNPLVWALVAEARRAGEDAADEAVLASGLAPADYAAHLLDLAASPGRGSPVFALTAARRPDLSRRIHRMLHRHPNPSRRSRGLSTVAIVGSATTLFGVAGTAALIAPVQAGSADDRASSSWAPDVRNRLSKAATPGNGFVGMLADGHKVTVTMVVRRTTKGIEAWTPDGKPLRGIDLKRIPFDRSSPHSRTVVARFYSESSTAEAGLGSGPRTGGEPSVLVFSGGWTERVGKTYEMYSFIGVPKEDGSKASFTMLVDDGESGWKPTADLPATVGSQPDAGMLSKIGVQFPATAKPLIRDTRGWPLRDAKGISRRRDVPGLLSLSFETIGDEAPRQFRVVLVRRDGVVKAPVWTDAGRRGDRFARSFYFQVAPGEARTFQIQSLGSHQLELIDVALKPNR